MKPLPVFLLLALLLLSSCDSAPGPTSDVMEAIQGHWTEAWVEQDVSMAFLCELPPGLGSCPNGTANVLKHTTELELFDGRFAATTRPLVFPDSTNQSDTLRTTFAFQSGYYALRGDTLLLTRDEPEVTERYMVRLYVDSLRLSAPRVCDAGADVCTLDVPAAKLPWAGSGFLKLGGRFVRGSRYGDHDQSRSYDLVQETHVAASNR